jgi:hypothetical protein
VVELALGVGRGSEPSGEHLCLSGELGFELLELLSEHGVVRVNLLGLLIVHRDAWLAISVEHGLRCLPNHHRPRNNLDPCLREDQVLSDSILAIRSSSHAVPHDHRGQSDSGQERSECGLARKASLVLKRRDGAI